ncbi:MAG: oxidoreductase [Planctomycetota bacterium]|jgi:2,4-dienoyl-CoA reductase-like NADH-dependent reductase (Old Yellow Enzyme family)
MRFEHDPADLEALAEPVVLLDSERRRIVARNRIVYQPMEGNDALPGGGPSPVTIARYLERAKGGAGIDHVEAVAISREAKARGDQLVLDESTRGGFERLVAEYRSENDATPLLVQLTHSGRFAEDPVTPYPLEGSAARPLTDADMERIREDLVRATRLAFECGADGIDFKHCHGYLFGAMLGPANRARPGWSLGGETIEERARFFVETTARMMDEVPADRFLYTVRLSAFEGIRGGFGSRDAESAEEDETHAELRELVRILARAGVRLINQSAGVPDITPLLVRQTNENPRAFFEQQRRAQTIKSAVSVPVVGSGYSYLKAGNNKLPGRRSEKHIVALGGKAIREGRVDLIGIGRQSLSEPLFATKLLAGDFAEIRWDTSCNRCAVSLRSGIHTGCVTYDRHYSDLFESRENDG